MVNGVGGSQASQAAQGSQASRAAERPGEREPDGDADDVGKATAAQAQQMVDKAMARQGKGLQISALA